MSVMYQCQKIGFIKSRCIYRLISNLSSKDKN